MDSFGATVLCDGLLIGALCIARYVFKVEGLIEWYVPACIVRWLEPKDLTEGVNFYQEKN